jgi:Uma2 family endonuclease
MSSSVPALAPVRASVDDERLIFPITVDAYHRMIAEGILPEGEPFELLNGQIIRKDRSAAGEDPMTVGSAHAWVIGTLAELNPKLRRLGCHIRVQLPLTFVPLSEPEPDGAIVLGSKDDYRDHHPAGEDVTCVIELADSSLRRDRSTKLAIYAGAKVPCYIIINLVDRLIEVYTQPRAAKVGAARYGSTVTLQPADRLELPVARGRVLRIPVRKLLP